MSDVVTTQMRDDGVAVITIDDGRKNAMTTPALAQLREAIAAAEEQATAIVLAGRPGVFCAGFDLATMTGDDPAAVNALALGGSEIALALWSCPRPIVAACTGHAFTIGAIWLCTADTRIGSTSPSKVSMNETLLGATLPPWALEPLAARVPTLEWMRTIVQSHVHDSESSVGAGFLDELVEAEGVIERAVEVASGLAQLPAKAYGINKLANRGPSIEAMRADIARLRGG
ncbi:MAG: crotonase/enoyl-CoA hydratase family protein [Actinomycetota bacterium]